MMLSGETTPFLGRVSMILGRLAGHRSRKGWTVLLPLTLLTARFRRRTRFVTTAYRRHAI